MNGPTAAASAAAGAFVVDSGWNVQCFGHGRSPIMETGLAIVGNANRISIVERRRKGGKFFDQPFVGAPALRQASSPPRVDGDATLFCGVKPPLELYLSELFDSAPAVGWSDFLEFFRQTN